MRIAMVTDYYLPTLGGVQTVIKAHREALEHAGHEVIVFTPLAKDSSDPGVVRLPTARGFAPDGYPFTWPPAAAARVLRAEFAARRVDLVHVHTEMFAALAGYRVAAELGIPVVQTMHGRLDVYTRSVLPLPALSTALLAALHRRQLPHESAVGNDAAPYARTRTAQRMWRLMVSQANRAAHVIVPSAHFAAKLHTQGVRTPMTVLSNGIEDSVLDAIGPPATRHLTADEPLRVIWCGRLSPEKRPDVFVDAVRQTLGITADMFGDGVSRRNVTERANGIAALTVHGGVAQAEVLAAMRRAHVLVSSSLDFDNQPMVILEAIATGLGVIVADPDLAEMLPPDGGLVCSTPDAAGIAAALHTLQHEPERIARMSAAAAAHRGQIAQSTHRDSLLAVYRSALGR